MFRRKKRPNPTTQTSPARSSPTPQQVAPVEVDAGHISFVADLMAQFDADLARGASAAEVRQGFRQVVSHTDPAITGGAAWRNNLGFGAWKLISAVMADAYTKGHFDTVVGIALWAQFLSQRVRTETTLQDMALDNDIGVTGTAGPSSKERAHVLSIGIKSIDELSEGFEFQLGAKSLGKDEAAMFIASGLLESDVSDFVNPETLAAARRIAKS